MKQQFDMKINGNNKKIFVDGRWLYVIDESPTHYICEPHNRAEGYCYISKHYCNVLKGEC